MPIPQEMLEQEAVRRIAEQEDAARDRTRDLFQSAVLCVFWTVAGLFLIMWSAHTSSLFHGKLAFYSGIIIGNGGLTFTLLGAYRRGEQRGDW